MKFHKTNPLAALAVAVALLATVEAQTDSCACNTSSNFVALRSLYADLGNPPSLNWVSSNSVCSFQGVYCYNGLLTQVSLYSISTASVMPTTWNLPSVTYLSTYSWSNAITMPTANFIGLMSLTSWSFSSFTFAGSLPSTFNGLSSLRQLQFQSCKFTGSIPSAWSVSTSLTYLYLSSVTMDGSTMTTSFTGLSQLQQLSVVYSTLTGSLPTTWSGLTLQTLDLSGNQFTGSMPSMFSGLSALGRLYLQSNQLSGGLSGTMSGVPYLSYLILDVNSITSLPSTWTGLSQLTSFSCQSCQISSLPSSWSGLPSLQYLYLSNNGMRGDLSAVSTLPNLRYLTLGSNKISGTFPSAWGTGASSVISQISLNNNALSGTFPHTAVGYGALTWLYLNSNQLSGGIGPTSITGFPNLQMLQLQNNAFNGTLYFREAFREMTSLRYLYLQSNSLSGTLGPFDDPFLLPNLLYLYLSDNRIGGTLPSQWIGLQNLTYLMLQNNQLSGTFPNTWNVTSPLLRYLYLSNNSLVGTLPANLSGLQGLFYLYLSYNRFGGALPTVWSPSFSQLYGLYLDHNSFSSIPSCEDACDKDTTTISSWSALRSLQSLNLASNAFDGTVPWTSTILQLPNLYFLNLSDNCFTGTLPDELSSQLPNFETLDLSNNLFSGTIPSTWSWSYLELLALNDNALSGTLPPFLPADEVNVLRLEGNRLRSRLPDAWGASSGRFYLYSLSLCRSSSSKGGNNATPESNVFCAPVPSSWSSRTGSSTGAALFAAVQACERLVWACTESASLPSVTLSQSTTQRGFSQTATSSETAMRSSATDTGRLSPTDLSVSPSHSLTPNTLSRPEGSRSMSATASATASPTPTGERLSISVSESRNASPTLVPTATDGECRGPVNTGVTVLAPNSTTTVAAQQSSIAEGDDGSSSTDAVASPLLFSETVEFRFLSAVSGETLAGTFNASIGPLGPWSARRVTLVSSSPSSTADGDIVSLSTHVMDRRLEEEDAPASFLHFSVVFAPHVSSSAAATVWLEFGCATERRSVNVTVSVLPLLVRPATAAERAADVTLAVAASASASLGAAQDANLQTLLSLVHCGQRAKPPHMMAVYLLSPFFDFGNAAMAFGNVGLVLGVSLLHGALVAGLWQWRRRNEGSTSRGNDAQEMKPVVTAGGKKRKPRRKKASDAEGPHKGSSSQDDFVRRLLSDRRALRSAAATLRFPNFSIKVMELLFQGSLYASVRLAWAGSDDGGGGGGAASVVLGVLAVALNVGLLAVLHAVVVHVVLSSTTYRAHPPWTPAWRAHMLPSNYWGPRDLRIALSPLLPLQREWTHYVVAVLFGLPFVMGILTGMENRSSNGCLIIFSCIATAFAVAAVLMAVARPHRVPLVSAFGVVKFSLLSAICAVQAHSNPAGAAAGLNLAHSAVLYVALGHRLMVMWFERQSDMVDDAAADKNDDDDDRSAALLSSETDSEDDRSDRPLNLQGMSLLLPTDATSHGEGSAMGDDDGEDDGGGAVVKAQSEGEGKEVPLLNVTAPLDDDVDLVELHETERVDSRNGFSVLVDIGAGGGGGSSFASGSDLLLSFYQERESEKDV